MKLYYTYILHSKTNPTHYYTGFTEDVESRLKAHNNGQVPSTDKYKPWQLKTVIAFASKEKAIQFEKYLKTASGRAFAKKRL